MVTQDDMRAYRRSRWEAFFDRIDIYIDARIVMHTGNTLEDVVRCTELRRDLIESLLNKEFNCS